jgi:hypothetical protein
MPGMTRLTRRFPLRVPLTVRLLDMPEVAASASETANISAGGALFATDLPLATGNSVELTLRMPEEVVGRPSNAWRCRGRVVRVAPGTATEIGPRVAVEFQYYELLGGTSEVDLDTYDTAASRRVTQ